MFSIILDCIFIILLNIGIMNSNSEYIHKILTTYFDKANLLTNEVDLISYSYDASFYALKPLLVVRPKNIEEIQILFKIVNQEKIPLTFRTAGTSLSGQSITNGILADIGYYWKNYEILNKGESIVLEPGIIGSHANEFLKKYHRKIGPDPASINSCMIGGILANNASGMCCGVENNSYHTLQKIQVVLPNGYILDTFKENYKEDFKNHQKELYEQILEIRNSILKKEELVQKIKNKYKIKNTTGYSLNAFIDYEDPADILAHLMIGSEGTLGFIAKAQLKTIPDKKYKFTGLVCFENIFKACEIIPLLKDMKASAVELMDRLAIKSIENKKEAPEFLKQLPEEGTTLLIEFEEDTQERLESLKEEVLKKLKKFNLIFPPYFTQEKLERENIWKIRKGLFPSVGSIRKSGTTVIIEDVAFPLEYLPYATVDLQKLFKKYNYSDAIIFGHAKDGNLHFVISQSFNTNEEIERYNLFLNEVVDIVANQYKGSLKAEHGTGRNIAPFVEIEWGKELYEIMKKIKSILDPNYILNPDVIISNSKNIHIENLKKIPIIESVADKCIECGFCENVCPSREITSTPRKRIILRREIERNPEIVSSKMFSYYLFDTCVRCGLCEIPCPVSINTGELVKSLESKKKSNTLKEKTSILIVKYFSFVEKWIYWNLLILKILQKFINKNFLRNIMNKLNQIFRTPIFLNDLFKPSQYYKKIKYNKKNKEKVDFYFFPTCLSRVLNSSSKIDLIEIIQSIENEFDLKIQILDSTGYCCSQPFESKSLFKAKEKMSKKTYDFLLNNIKPKPIIVDNSSCTYSFRKNSFYKDFEFLDILEFANLLIQKKPEKFKKIYNKIYIQNICSVQKLKLQDLFLNIGNHISKKVEFNSFSECCGFAGDRGIFYPEINQSAIKNLQNRLDHSNQEEKIEKYISSNLTCELGLSNTGYEFNHILFVLYEILKKEENI